MPDIANAEEEIMGKLVVTEFITLDGVVDDPGGSESHERGGWAFRFERGDEGDTFKWNEVVAADAQLLGRVTYEGFAQAWPSREGEFADRFNSMPKFVVSTTLTDPEWTNSTVLRGGDTLAQEIDALKAQLAGDLLLAGSVTLVHSLLAADLVDQLNLMTFPVVLGSGKRLFADAGPELPFELVDLRQTGQVSISILTRKR
jgi:dihydrofolate reductase